MVVRTTKVVLASARELPDSAPMNLRSHTAPAAAALCAALSTFPAAAQWDDKWSFDAIIYAYLPDIGGKTTFHKTPAARA